jgi:hypothetical protein
MQVCQKCALMRDGISNCLKDIFQCRSPFLPVRVVIPNTRTSFQAPGIAITTLGHSFNLTPDFEFWEALMPCSATPMSYPQSFWLARFGHPSFLTPDFAFRETQSGVTVSTLSQ